MFRILALHSCLIFRREMPTVAACRTHQSMKFAKGAIMRCFFHRLPTLVPASEARAPSSPARAAHQCDREAIARFQVVPTFARGPRSVAWPRTNHGYLQSTRSPVVPASVPRTDRAPINDVFLLDFARARR